MTFVSSNSAQLKVSWAKLIFCEVGLAFGIKNCWVDAGVKKKPKRIKKG